jgi:hypothetical protein
MPTVHVATVLLLARREQAVKVRPERPTVTPKADNAHWFAAELAHPRRWFRLHANPSASTIREKIH